MKAAVRKSPQSVLRTILALSCIGAGLLAGSSPASAATIYITNGGDGTVGAYTTDGQVINAALITGLSGPDGIAVDNQGHIFVANGLSGTIGEYTTSGAAINTSLITGLDAPVSIALDGNGDLFVMNQSSLGNNGFVGEYTTSGTPINTHLISGLFVPRDVALDGNGHIFVTTGQSLVAEYATSGTLVNGDLVPLGGGIALDGSGNIYVASTFFDPIKMGFRGNVGVYTTDGATINPSLFSDFGAPAQIELALDQDGDIFVAAANGVGEYTTAGGVVNASLISGLGFQGASAIAIGAPAPTPLPPALWAGTALIGMVGLTRFVRCRKPSTN